MRVKAEQIVDAVGAALGVDTGICNEAQFNAAVEAVVKVLTGDTPEGEKLEAPYGCQLCDEDCCDGCVFREM